MAELRAGYGEGHVVVIRGIRNRNGFFELFVNDPMSKVPNVIDFNDLIAYWAQTIIVHDK